MKQLIVKYHPLSKGMEYPSFVDIFAKGRMDEPVGVMHIDQFGDMLLGPEGKRIDDNKLYYAELKKKGQVVLKVEIITEDNQQGF